MDWTKALSGAVVIAGLGIGSPAATDYGEGNARARLVRSADTAGTDTTFLLGVEFDIRPGWHIYWRNPGGAGLATELQWRLPEDFVVGDLQWPLPVGFVQSGEIPGFGYEGSVVLAAEIRSVDEIEGSRTIGASVSWLACKDVCVLGSAELEADLAGLQVDPVFESWSDLQAQPFDPEGSPFSLSVRGGLTDGTLGLWLQWIQVPKRVEWFPDPQEGLEVTGVTVQTRGGLTRIDSEIRRMRGSTGTSNNLDSVLVITDNIGVRRGWKLAVDVGRE